VKIIKTIPLVARGPSLVESCHAKYYYYYYYSVGLFDSVMTIPQDQNPIINISGENSEYPRNISGIITDRP